MPALLKDAEAEAARLNAEIEALKAKGNAAAAGHQATLPGLAPGAAGSPAQAPATQRTGRANLDLVVAEQDRLDQQIKLIRADAVATKNAETLTARIDATVEHLDQTNKWLSEMDEFKDLVGDMPSTDSASVTRPPPPHCPPHPPRPRRSSKGCPLRSPIRPVRGRDDEARNPKAEVRRKPESRNPKK